MNLKIILPNCMVDLGLGLVSCWLEGQSIFVPRQNILVQQLHKGPKQHSVKSKIEVILYIETCSWEKKDTSYIEIISFFLVSDLHVQISLSSFKYKKSPSITLKRESNLNADIHSKLGVNSKCLENAFFPSYFFAC